MTDTQVIGVRREFVLNTPLRLVLYPGEIIRFPPSGGTIRVISGRAWLTADGTDLAIAQGGMTAFRKSRSGIVVSALAGSPLTLEYQGK
jgi:hypothetical protein